MSNINAKIASDSATVGFGRVSFSHHLSYYFHGIFTLEDYGDEWARSNETYQVVKESFSFMNGVVALGQIFINMQHLHSHDFKPLPFQARNDFPGQSSLYGIRFDKN
jgi:hypothetical protein